MGSGVSHGQITMSQRLTINLAQLTYQPFGAPTISDDSLNTADRNLQIATISLGLVVLSIRSEREAGTYLVGYSGLGKLQYLLNHGRLLRPEVTSPCDDFWHVYQAPPPRSWVRGPDRTADAYFHA